MTNSFSRLRALFEQCADLPEGERTRWLDVHVPDTGQRIEIELMLAADAGGGGFLRRDVVSHIGHLSDAQEREFGPENLIGRRFGAFELERLIGRGGQGAVYLARRVGGDFAQAAAVKLLRRGLHDSAEHRRFRREREILGRFEHAGVARLIDGGVSAEGMPYLVMEYVEGLPIDQWCTQQGLQRSARLRLFVELCEVVAAAQRALIVHRDLKPSNVLVTNEGRIKVLDFGIARLLDEDEAATQTNAPILTPGYGAPEQESGGVITLATDVHALGVLLRVLLTGVTPKRAGAGVQGLPDDLPPELRWILGKACAAEPERRYRDAAELGEDVARFLAAQPVRANPPSRWYSVRKFVARHRGGVLTTVAVLLGLLASFSIALWQAKVAREEKQRAEAARDFLLGVFDSAKEDLPRDARPTPDVLVRAAAKRLDEDAQLSPTLRAEFLGNLSRISYSSNDYAQAAEYAEHALGILAANGQGESRQALLLLTKRANALVQLGKPAEADSLLGGHMAALRSVADETTLEGLGAYLNARIYTGHVDESVALAREAAQLADKVYGKDTKETLIVAAMYGDVLAYTGQHKEAAAQLDSVLERWRAIKAPQDHYFANSLQNLATAKYQVGDAASGERLQREALELLRRIYTAPHEKIADTLFSLATPLMEAGRTDEAEKVLLEAASMYAALFPPLHPQNAGMADGLGSLEMTRGRYGKAVEHLQRATNLCTEGKFDENPECSRYWQNLSAAYLRLQRVDDAAMANAHALELRRKVYGETHAVYARSLAGRADVELARGKSATALATIEQALKIFVAKAQSEGLGYANMCRARAAALHALQRDGEALTQLDEADAAAQRASPGNAGYRIEALILRAEIEAASGHGPAATQAAQAVLALQSANGSLAPEAKRAIIGDARWQRMQELAR